MTHTIDRVDAMETVSVERLAEILAAPKYARGTVVAYRDQHDRMQTGKVYGIEAHWHFGPKPLLIYTISHPSYRNKRMHGAENCIVGAAL